MRKVLEDIKVVELDIKALEKSLRENELLDDKKLWFAGFNDSRRADINAITANFFYGKSKLVVVSIYGDTIYYCRNSKEGFKVRLFGNVSKSNKLIIRRNIMYPSVDMINSEGVEKSVKITMNKSILKSFKKYMKQK